MKPGNNTSYVLTISRDDLIKALQFRFKMINDDSRIAITNNDAGYLRIGYSSVFLGCNIDSNIFIDIDWLNGLIKRHFCTNYDVATKLPDYKLRSIIANTIAEKEYSCTFELSRY